MDKTKMTESQRISKLELPPGILDMVLDTDTFNEVDDQFALAYALLSKERLNVEAVYAAPFFNDRSESPGDGMERSYQEILRIFSIMGLSPEDRVFRGSDKFLPGAQPVDSPAARDLIKRAKARDKDNPLYIVSIAAVTNVASAIIMCPEIVERIVVVWLGGQPLHWPDTNEFNLSQDIPAARTIFDCGVPLIHIPAYNASSQMITTLAELKACIGGKNALCDALIDLFAESTDDHFAYARPIWDITAIGYLIEPGWVPAPLVHSPVLNDGNTWSRNEYRHMIRSATFADRNQIYRDIFTKLAQL